MQQPAWTGVRLVLSNSADPARAAEASEWYNDYATAITDPDRLADVLRFENPGARGIDMDPQFLALYDLAAPDPATAWPETENSPRYPTSLFDDPRAPLVVPVLRGSWATVGSIPAPEGHEAMTGVHIVLSEGADDTVRHDWEKAVADTGRFYAVTRYRLIEGFPHASSWLEVYETADPDPLTAYERATKALAPRTPDAGAHPHIGGSYRLFFEHHTVAKKQPVRS